MNGPQREPDRPLAAGDFVSGFEVVSAAPLEEYQAVGIQASVVHRVIALLHPADLSPSDAARLFPSYLEAVERLAAYVDEWTR